MNKQNVQIFSLGLFTASALLYIWTLVFGWNDFQSARSPEENEGMILVEQKQIDSYKAQIAALEEENSKLAEQVEREQTSQENTAASPNIQNEEATSDEEHEDENQEEASENITFEVMEGMTSTDIAKGLKSIGIIEDAVAFEQYMINSGLDRKIQIGVYSLNKNMSEAEIAKQIVN